MKKVSAVSRKQRAARAPRREHIYAYAVVAGTPAARALAKLPAMPDGSRLRALSLHEGVSLIVCDVPSASYNPATIESRLTDLDWVSRSGATHHAVSDALSDSFVVLPLRLFTLFSSEEKALAALGRRRLKIAKALDRVKGKKEWVLRIGKPDPSRLVVQPTPAEEPTSGTGFLRAKGQARKESADRSARVKVEAARVFESLRELADESTARAIEPAASLLMDAAFLVNTRKTRSLQQTLTRSAASLLQDGCPVSLTGPWPPYSFAALD